jgi:hypothetical protein
MGLTTALVAVIALLSYCAVLVNAHGGSEHVHVNPARPAPRGPKRSVYVAIRVEGHCEASLGEIHEVDGYQSEFHDLPMELPAGKAVEDVCPFEQLDFGTSGVNAEYRKMTWMVSFIDPSSKIRRGQVFLDPRIRVGESRFGPSTNFNDDDVSLHHKTERDDGVIPIVHHLHIFPDIHFVRVPLNVTEVTLHCRNTSAAMRMAVTERRHFKAQDAATGIKFKSYAVGPVDTQTNVVFISAGFLANQEKMFEQIVERLRDGFNPVRTRGNGFEDMHDSVPFDRYFSFYNVFTVFQPSNEAGATRALVGTNVDNNLKCYHPTTMERAITCNIELSMALASVSPAPVKTDPDRCVVVVIVNTNLYGGSAMYRRGLLHLGHFYRGYTGSLTMTDVGQASDYDELKFNSLVKHELGHAFGNLFDEYDIGISEPTDQPLLNCQSPQGVGHFKWQYWQSLLAQTNSPYQLSGQSDFKVSSQPLSVCGYSNYYKPTSRCMMNAVRDYFYCPVCREAATRTILNPGTSFQWPRVPRDQGIMYLLAANVPGDYAKVGAAYLYLPQGLRAGQGFAVTWTWQFPGQAVQTHTPNLASTSTEVSSLFLSPERLQGAPTDELLLFNVTVTDSTNYYVAPQNIPSITGLTQNYTFQVIIKTSMPTIDGKYVSATNITDIVSLSNIPVDRPSTGTFYAVIEFCNTSTCNISFAADKYETPVMGEGVLGELENWVLIMQACIAVLFIGLWIWAFQYYKGKSSKVVRPVFRTQFTGIVNLVRRVMIFAAVMFMASSLAALGVSAYFYTKTTSLGKIIIIVGTVLSFGLYIMAFIGFWAVSYRSKKLVIVNGAVLYVGLTVLVICSALAISIGTQITDRKSYWNQNLEVFWRSLVQSSPDRACAIEGMLQCSGFYIACNTIVQSTEHCPSGCDLNNRQFGTGCQLLIRDYISQNYQMILIVCGSCVGLMFGGLLFNFIYFVGLAKLKRDIRRSNDRRLEQHAHRTNSTMKQIDKCKALYILKTLDDGDLNHLMKEFRRIDEDGNGQLDRAEFLKFFTKALCYKPTSAEIDEIFRVADLDNDGTVSMDEFLCLFNTSGQAMQQSPRTRGGSKQTPLLRSMDPQREQEMRRRAAKVFGEELSGGNNTAVQLSPKNGGNTGRKPAYRPTQTQIPDPEGLL